MPTFCRHNRFIERCPICRQTLPGYEEPSTGAAAPRARASSPGAPAARRAPSGRASRVRGQSVGVRGRLLALGAEPPGLYSEARELAKRDLEQATWACFLIAYLSPLEGAEPFAGIRMALGSERDELADLEGIPLGPRTSYEAARGGE